MHSRRQVLAGSAALALGSVAAARQGDPAGPAGVDNAGHYHTRVGSLDVTLVTDGHFFSDPLHPTFGRNVAPEHFAAAVRKYHVPADGLAHVHTLLIRGNGRTTLVDAGSGDTFAPTCGRLIGYLRAAGVEPGDVTDVLLTHAHLDHIGGLGLPGGGGATFPNADVHVSRVERDFWRGRPALEDMPVPEELKQQVIDLANAGFDLAGDRLKTLEDGDEPVPGVTAVAAPGHTPGHTMFEIADGGERLLFVGDLLFLVPVLTRHPDWHVAFDADPVEAAATRFRVLDRVATDRLRICGSHLPFPGFGHLRRSGAGFDYLPEMWRW